MNEKRICHKIFFPWNCERERKWLNKMSKEGWILEKVEPYTYHFLKGEAQNIIYDFDYQILNEKDFYEYRKLFKDMGWEHISSFANWHYFMNRNEHNTTAEIFTDRSSRILKYKALIRTLFLCMLPLINMIIMMSVFMDSINSVFGITLIFIGAFFTAFFSYSIIRLFMIIKKQSGMCAR